MDNVLQYLNEVDQKSYRNIMKCRAMGADLNLEHQFALRLINHDWTHAMSDDSSVWRAGRAAELALVGEISLSELPEAIKQNFMALFTMSYEEQTAALAEYSWLNQFHWIDRTPKHGPIALAMMDIDEEKRIAYFEMAKKLKAIGQGIKDAKASQRLIMTDDCIHFKLLREHAQEVAKDKDRRDNMFFFGVALPEHVQNSLDQLLREEKDMLVSFISSKAAEMVFTKADIDSNWPDGVWLVKFQTTNDYRDEFGFYLNPARKSRPRRVWVPSENNVNGSFVPKVSAQVEPVTAVIGVVPTIPKKKVQPALSARPMAAPVENAPKKVQQKKAPAKRRQQFEVIRSVTS